ncbi:MAG: nuclear export factor [Polaromonas sp.]|nr:nuclear export factor [Polaromonas sp.]
MNMLFTGKTVAACAFGVLAFPALSHVSLENRSALAGSSYKAVFQVGHGCDGSATTGLSIRIPTGFIDARPYQKAGWTLSVQREKLAAAGEIHGKPVADAVNVVSWTANSLESAQADAHLDEFMLRGKLPDTGGPLWFKVLQTCEKGSKDWNEIPAAGISQKSLKLPAVLLEVTAAEGVAAPQPAKGPAPGAHQH